MKKIGLILLMFVLLFAPTFSQSTSGGLLMSIGIFDEDVVIPLVAILSAFGMPVLIIFIIMSYRNKEKMARYSMVEKAIEAGRDLPEDFFKGLDSGRESTLGTALSAIGVGLALVIALYMWPIVRMYAFFGLVPLFIGLAKLIAWKIEQSKKEREDQGGQQ